MTSGVFPVNIRLVGVELASAVHLGARISPRLADLVERIWWTMLHLGLMTQHNGYPKGSMVPIPKDFEWD